MSAWRIALNELHAAGGEASYFDFGDRTGRERLGQLGLAEWYGGSKGIRWRLTPLGWDVAEGRVVVRRNGPAPMAVRATWLAAMPRA